MMADYLQFHLQQAPQHLQSQTPSPGRSAIDKLPLDILILIADLLDYISLLDFSTTSRKNKWASNPAKFRVVRLSSTTPESLNAAVEQAAMVLGTAESQDHVQHLEIVTSRDGPRGAEPMLDRNGKRHLQPVDPFYSDRMQMYHWRQSQTHEQWHLLNDFVQALSGLKELTWGSVERVPVQLVRILSASQIKLNLYGLDLPISVEPVDSVELSPDTIQILTAPALHSLSCACPLGPLEPHHYAGIITDMIAGAAPHVRHVYITTTLPPAVHPSTLVARPRRRPWLQGKLHPDSASTPSPLQSLSLSRAAPNPFLQQFSAVTSVQTLRELTIEEDVTRIDFAWLSGQTFTNLGRLKVRIHPRRCPSQHPDQTAFLSLVTALPHLTHLDFDLTLDQMALRHIIECYGRRLRQLNADRCFVNLSFVQQIRQSCPDIEELSLGMHRWAGSVAETAMYRALGTLHSLEVLQLRIRSFQAETCCETYDSLWSDTVSPMEVSYFDEPELDQAYHALRDLAFDETLARSIYSMISSSKPSYSRPLEQLDLWVDSELDRKIEYMLGDGARPFVLQRITRSWHCTRDLCDLRPQQCFTRSKQPHPRHGFSLLETDEQRTQLVEKFVSGPGIRAVHLAWPETRHKPFDQAWHSFAMAQY